MAVIAGQPSHNLTNSSKTVMTRETALETSFFELLRQLEGANGRFGRVGGPSNEPARLGQRARLNVATRDIAGFTPKSETHPAKVEVEVLGLLGPEGILPLHMTRWILERLSERWFETGADSESSDTTFLEFCNMLQHRMLSLYWRAWADSRPGVQYEQDTGGRTQSIIDTLAGVGLPGTQNASQINLKQRHATSLGQEVHGVERLANLLEDFIGAPVTIQEFTGGWLEIPQSLQSQLGTEFSGLGTGAVVGTRVFQPQKGAELQVGPLSLTRYKQILELPNLVAQVRQLIIFAVGKDTEFDLRLILEGAEIPEPKIGSCQLGRTTWLSPKRTNDAKDLRLGNITDDKIESYAA
jgi:type VI secretion system protein ImpH